MLSSIKRKVINYAHRCALEDIDKIKLLHGKILSNNMVHNNLPMKESEFSVFSQFGDDGLIQWLINNLDIPNSTFIEFGVENYSESNTRFLLMNNNWSGYILDASIDHINEVKKAYYYWKYDLVAERAFVDTGNINNLINNSHFDENVGLLHIDVDGMDYYIWEAIQCIHPIIVIVEYNSVFGAERPIVVPYATGFNRTSAHYSNLYAGSSLKALCLLAYDKGYAFVGSNHAGNNAYFIRNDKVNKNTIVQSVDSGYVLSKFRESRGQDGRLTLLRGKDRLREISGLPVLNVETGNIEEL